ncbi:MAG: hypothetical protein ACOC1I_01195 [Spirochaetota bacterium]
MDPLDLGPRRGFRLHERQRERVVGRTDTTENRLDALGSFGVSRSVFVVEAEGMVVDAELHVVKLRRSAGPGNRSVDGRCRPA